MRKELGITITGVFQDTADENHVTVISEMPSEEIAKAILSSPEFRATAQKSGVTSTPEIKLLNRIS